MVMPVLAVAATQFPDYSPMMVGIAIGGYGLTQAALQIPMGMMSDRWGRKPVILLGLTVFALGSIVAAMADTMAWMIAGRVLQGAGAIAGAIMALATAYLTSPDVSFCGALPGNTSFAQCACPNV